MSNLKEDPHDRIHLAQKLTAKGYLHSTEVLRLIASGDFIVRINGEVALYYGHESDVYDGGEKVYVVTDEVIGNYPYHREFENFKVEKIEIFALASSVNC